MTMRFDGRVAVPTGAGVLVNNAGILRDKSFTKMTLDDFRRVVEVHLMGAVNCSKAVWDIMRAQNHGGIVMTTSSSGLYGNFGPSNHGAAQMALVGLMQTLSIEGAKNNIRVNGLAPTAAEQVALRFEEVSDREGESVPASGNAQGTIEVGKAMRALG